MSDLLLEVHPFLTFLVLVVVMAGAIIAHRALRNTRRILRLSERRMQYLSEEQDRLTMLKEEYKLLEKTLKQERLDRLGAHQNVVHLENLRSPRKQQGVR
jgi:sensor histidine kinase YesM